MRKFLILSLVALAAGSAFAAQGRNVARQQQPPPVTQQPPPAGQEAASQEAGREGARKPADPPGLRPDEVQAIVDGWEMTTAERMLQLSEQQYVPFIQHLRKLQDARRRHLNQRQRMLMALRQVTNQQPPADDATIEARLKQFDELEKQSYQNIQAAHGALDTVLTVRQRARFRLVQEQIERQKLQLVAKVMRAGGPGR